MLNYKKNIKFLVLIFACLVVLGLYNIKTVLATIGSELTTIQAYTQILPANNATNEIGSATLMDNGFYLNDRTTTCTNNSIYPLRGLLNFNQGKFYLNRNTYCAGSTYFGQGGEIDGNGYTINLAKTPQTINFPDLNATTTLTGGYSTQTMGASVNSVSWSYNDKYVAAGDSATSSNLSVYGFSSGTLSTISGMPITVRSSVNVTTVSWNPTNYLLAVGTNAATSGLYIYKWNPSTQSLGTATSNPTITGVINAVAWSPNGQYLAVSYATGASSAVQVYSCTAAGVLAIAGSAYIYGATNFTTAGGALSWQSNGSLLAVGASNSVTGVGTLFVLVFNAATPSLTLGASQPLYSNTNIGSVAFRPINSNTYNVASNYMSVAITATTNASLGKQRLYEYYAGAIQTPARYSSAVGGFAFNATAWSQDGMLCAFAGVTGGRNLLLYFAPENNFWYVSTNTYLIQLPTSVNIASIQCVDFSNTTNNYIATGVGSSVRVYSFGQISAYRTTYSFNKTNLTLNSDLQLNNTLTVNGACTINGNNNKLILGPNASLNVGTGASLNLQDIEIVGLNKSNLQCLDNTGSIMLENSTLTLTSNFVFGSGSMLFNLGVKISGTNQFAYTSRMTSTINPYSFLYLDRNLTFSYSPAGAYRNLIYMPNNSSWLILDGCTLHSTRTGLWLTAGQVFIDNNVSLQSEGVYRSQAIQLGNGTPKYDLTINLLAAAQLNISGRVEYANSN